MSHWTKCIGVEIRVLTQCHWSWVGRGFPYEFTGFNVLDWLLFYLFGNKPTTLLETYLGSLQALFIPCWSTSGGTFESELPHWFLWDFHSYSGSHAAVMVAICSVVFWIHLMLMTGHSSTFLKRIFMIIGVAVPSASSPIIHTVGLLSPLDLYAFLLLPLYIDSLILHIGTTLLFCIWSYTLQRVRRALRADWMEGTHPLH